MLLSFDIIFSDSEEDIEESIEEHIDIHQQLRHHRLEYAKTTNKLRLVKYMSSRISMNRFFRRPSHQVNKSLPFPTKVSKRLLKQSNSSKSLNIKQEYISDSSSDATYIENSSSDVLSDCDSSFSTGNNLSTKLR